MNTLDLITAIHLNKANVVVRLLEAGFDPNSVEDADDVTPLHHAAAYGSVEIVTALIAAGAKVDSLTIEDKIPLDYAALAKNKQVFDLLTKIMYSSPDSIIGNA